MGLEAQGLEIVLKKRTILNEVDLLLDSGSIMALLGPNGSGKSTLLKTFMGLIRPHKGEIRIDGDNARKLSRRRLASQVAYVAQKVEFGMPFSVLDCVLMGRFPHLGFLGLYGTEDRSIALESLEKLDLSGFEDRPVTALSGGEAQRVALARALAQRPRFFLLDEPTSALDPRHTLLVVELLKSLRKEGAAVLVVLHDINLALAFADRLFFLKEGTLVASRSPTEVDEKLLQTVYEIPWQLLRIDGRLFAFPANP